MPSRLWFPLLVVVASVITLASHARAQALAADEFEVVSVKLSAPDTASAGMQNLPDGSFRMRIQPISSIIRAASPVAVREVEGLPDWAMRDRYDIEAKAPARGHAATEWDDDAPHARGADAGEGTRRGTRNHGLRVGRGAA